MNIVQKSCLFFTIVGAVNWGLIGLFNFDLVATLFGPMSVAARIIYTIVGIAGLVNIMLFFVDLDDLTVLETPRVRAR